MVQGQRCGRCGEAHPAYVAACPGASNGRRTTTGAHTVMSEDEVLVGSVLEGRYHVEQVLGQGATGTVFAIRHLATGRAGALKVLRPRYSTADVVHRVFHGEAHAAWTVLHPGLCEVFDAGQLPDGTPFFAMERLVGETLETRIARERLSIGAAVDAMMQLLSALDAIHARDLLLRDLRPQNVFLAQRRGCRPVVKVLDFGLARLVPLERVQEEWDALRGVPGGTDGPGGLSVPYYLSPERTRGEHGIGPASDLFVVASIFYEALTGRKPFAATSFNGLLLQIAQAQVAPMTDVRADVPPALDALVRRTLSAHPQQRPASAAELQDELRVVFERLGRRASSRPAVASPGAAPAGAEHPRAPVEGAVTASGGSTARAPHRERASSSPSFSSVSALSSLPSTPAPHLDEPYADETRTDRNSRSIAAAAAAIIAAGPDVSRYPDEASADHPLRTLPPPRSEVSIDVEIDLEDSSDDTTRSRSSAAAKALVARAAAGTPARERGKADGADEEDETTTMELTPEIRARIDAMTQAAPASVAPLAPTVGGDGTHASAGPSTRRLK